MAHGSSSVAPFLPVLNAPVDEQIQSQGAGWQQVRVSAAALVAGAVVISTIPLKLHSIQINVAGTNTTAVRIGSNATTVAVLDNTTVHEYNFDSDLSDLTL